MRRVIVRAAVAVVVLLLVIQAVPYGRNHTNPPVRAEPTSQPACWLRG